jgi:predicted nuclease of predicted toxin-antitoxin system
MYFLLDENVDVRLDALLRDRGHDVEHALDFYPEGTPDEVLVAHVDLRGGLLVTGDRDFVRLIARRPADNRLRFRRAGRVLLSCTERRAAERLVGALHLIEAEHEYARIQPDPRIIVEIGGDVIRFER